MKLQLRSLRAINCGPLRDVCIHFNTEGEHPITVLAGANGSGKTTALELVCALCETLDLSYSEPDSPKQGLGILSRTEYAEIELSVNDERLIIFYGRRPSDVTISKSGSYFTRLSPEPSSVRQQGLLAQQLPEIIRSLKKATLVSAEAEPTASATLLPSILYLPHRRFIAPVEAKQVQREETEYKWVYRYESAKTFSGSLDSYLVWLDYAEPGQFAEDIEFLNNLDLEGKTFGVRRKELKAVVTTKDGKTHYLEDLSSGEQNILIMLLELHRRLLPGSIVLIDEIENSLHPAFQHRIAEGLMRLQEMVPFQLIVTTHSPMFVDIFGTASTRILTEF